MDNFNASSSPARKFEEEDLVSDGWTDIMRNLVAMLPPRRRAGHRAGSDRRDDGARRLSEDESDPRARGRHRQGHGDRRGAEALVSPVLQAPHLQRRVPADLQPAQREAGRYATGAASSASPRKASSSMASSTRSTASSSRPASRSAPPTRGAQASRSTAAAASRSPSIGPTGSRRCTVSIARVFRTASTWASHRMR